MRKLFKNRLKKEKVTGQARIERQKVVNSFVNNKITNLRKLVAKRKLNEQRTQEAVKEEDPFFA